MKTYVIPLGLILAAIAGALTYPVDPSNISLALILFATSGALVFTIMYGTLAPWWRTDEGRHMMVLTFGLFLLGATSLLRRVVGEWPGYEWTVLAIYAVVGWELWRRSVLFVKAQTRVD